jgi:3-hydroxyisobutyrate dehydrogenase
MALALHKIAIIGVGYVSHVVALNILKNNFELKFHDHPGNQPTEDLIALVAGIRPEVFLETLSSGAGVVFNWLQPCPESEDLSGF